MASIEALLSEVPFFKLLDGDERAALASLLTDADFAAGQAIFETGDPGDRMYVVGSGAVEISTTDKLGQRILLTMARPGDMFGELSLLDQGPRTARAVALEPTETLVLDRRALQEFVRRKPDSALDMMATIAQRLRQTNLRLQQTASRNVNEAVEKKQTAIEQIVDSIAAFSGSFVFLVIHLAIFAAWIGFNVLAGVWAFDPFPFGFLTMCVSLEAIFLSVIVLLSQNRQAAKDHIRADIEYDVNLKAELEVSHLHEKVDQLQAALLARLQRIEAGLPR